MILEGLIYSFNCMQNFLKIRRFRKNYEMSGIFRVWSASHHPHIIRRAWTEHCSYNQTLPQMYEQFLNFHHVATTDFVITSYQCVIIKLDNSLVLTVDRNHHDIYVDFTYKFKLHFFHNFLLKSFQLY